MTAFARLEPIQQVSHIFAQNRPEAAGQRAGCAQDSTATPTDGPAAHLPSDPESADVPVLLGVGSGSDDYEPDTAEVLRYLGYTNQRIDSALMERIEGVIAHCRAVSRPAWTYRILRVDPAQQPQAVAPLSLGEGAIELAGAGIGRHLTGARYCAVMAVTCGLGNERELQRLAAQGGFDAAVFDAAGSALVEAAADACNAAVIDEARTAGLFCNWRYGPGYEDLPLDLQPTIIRLLAADRRLGMSTTSSNLLVPMKSVTALIGLFETPQEERRSCATCSFRPHCSLKKRGMTCHQ